MRIQTETSDQTTAMDVSGLPLGAKRLTYPLRMPLLRRSTLPGGGSRLCHGSLPAGQFWPGANSKMIRVMSLVAIVETMPSVQLQDDALRV